MLDNVFGILGIALSFVSAMLGTSYGFSLFRQKLLSRQPPDSSARTTGSGSLDLWRPPSSRTPRDWQTAGRGAWAGDRFPRIWNSPIPYREQKDDDEVNAGSLVTRWGSPFLDRFLDRPWHSIENAWETLRPVRWLRVLLIVPIGLVCLAPFFAMVVPVAIVVPFVFMFDRDKDWRLRLIALTLPIAIVFDVLGNL